MFCEKILISLQIILCYHLQIDESKYFDFLEVWYIP